MVRYALHTVFYMVSKAHRTVNDGSAMNVQEFLSYPQSYTFRPPSSAQDRSKSMNDLVDNRALPLLQYRSVSIYSHILSQTYAARHLLSSSDSKTNARVSKEGRSSTRVTAEVEVDVCAVLVGTRQAVLGAQWVARRRAEVVDLDNDAVASVG